MAGARIVADGWAHAYPGSTEHVLANVSLSIDPGELVVLMGASGSGKSTLLAALSGTLSDGGGLGRLEVTRASGGGPGGVGGARGGTARIGLVQQEPEANIVMQRVGDDVAFPLENVALPADRIWPRVGAALAEVGLEVGWDRSTAQLSGGQQQLLAVAGAGVAGPDLLLLDEPTANLDPSAAAAVRDAVVAVRATAGTTVLVIEHRVEPWLAQADRVLLVEGGTVLDLTPAALRRHLAARPESAARVWLDRDHLPARPPLGACGHEVLVAADVALEGRLPPTSLVAHAGEVVALTGAPGTGKSTLLAALAGLLEPSRGTVRLPAGPGPAPGAPWHWPADEVAAAFGVVFQNPEHQFVTGRVLDEVHHGLVGAGVHEPAASIRAQDMLDRLHLSELAERNPFTLSGGEQRRLSVGTALALDPGILLLDEPTFGQDPTTWAQVVGIIADHRDAGGTVVLATHDPALVRALGAREVRLEPQSGPAVRERGTGPATGPGSIGGLRRLDPLALVGGAMLLSAAGLVSRSVSLNLALAAVAVLVALLG
ncbi:MAG: ABC transporter ATP-binding protein, partial [Candidatus Nanopelagicales bacterium]